MIDLSQHGERRIMIADGHDEASSSLTHQPHSSPQARRRWSTPSGKTVREGQRYLIEKRLVLSTARSVGGVRILRFRIMDHVISEAL